MSDWIVIIVALGAIFLLNEYDGTDARWYLTILFVLIFAFYVARTRGPI